MKSAVSSQASVTLLFCFGAQGGICHEHFELGSLPDLGRFALPGKRGNQRGICTLITSQLGHLVVAGDVFDALECTEPTGMFCCLPLTCQLARKKDEGVAFLHFCCQISVVEALLWFTFGLLYVRCFPAIPWFILVSFQGG